MRDREILEDLERIHGKAEVDRATAWMLRHGKRAAYVARCFEDPPGERAWDRVNGKRQSRKTVAEDQPKPRKTFAEWKADRLAAMTPAERAAWEAKLSEPTPEAAV